jgi:hypothetical protein
LQKVSFLDQSFDFVVLALHGRGPHFPDEPIKDECDKQKAQDADSTFPVEGREKTPDVVANVGGDVLTALCHDEFMSKKDLRGKRTKAGT